MAVQLTQKDIALLRAVLNRDSRYQTVARRLGITEQAARSRMYRLFIKIGASTKIEAIYMAVQQGLITISLAEKAEE